MLDVISYQSQSYFTTEHEIRVPVGPGDKVLPPLPTTKRMRVKSAVLRMGVSSVNKDGAQAAAMLAVQAPSQDNDAAPSEVSTAARADVDRYSKIDSAADALVNCLTDLVTDFLLGSMTAAVERLEVELRQDRDRINELKAFFEASKNSVSTQTTLENMAHELRQWITSDPTHR